MFMIENGQFIKSELYENDRLIKSELCENNRLLLDDVKNMEAFLVERRNEAIERLFIKRADPVRQKVIQALQSASDKKARQSIVINFRQNARAA